MITEEQVNAIGEVAVNVLYGTLPTTNVQKAKLKKYSELYDYIGNSSVSLKKRKEAIQNNLAGISLLLQVAKPLLKR